MKTLDKKISVSSDQLDTLTTEQRADKFAQVADDVEMMIMEMMVMVMMVLVMVMVMSSWTP